MGLSLGLLIKFSPETVFTTAWNKKGEMKTEIYKKNSSGYIVVEGEEGVGGPV